MGKTIRMSIAVIIFIALVGFGIFAFVGQDNLIKLADDFFTSVGSELSLSDNVIRNITFEYTGNSYMNTTFVFEEPSNITVDSDNFTIYTITTLEAKTPAVIAGFTGTVTIVETGEVIIAGDYEEIEIIGLKISTSGTITESKAKFNNVFLQDVKMKTLLVPEASGSLITDKIEMNLNNQTLEIFAPMADFFYGENVEIDGRANRIKITGENTVSVNR